MPGVLLDNSIGHGQSQTSAAPNAFGGEERIVDLSDVLGRNPHPGIGNFNNELSVIATSGSQ